MFYFQLVIMAGTVLLAYYFEYTDTFPVHIQGFFCYDKTFSKPYPGPDNTSKIPPVLIYSLVTAIPTITVRHGCMWCLTVKDKDRGRCVLGARGQFACVCASKNGELGKRKEVQ